MFQGGSADISGQALTALHKVSGSGVRVSFVWENIEVYDHATGKSGHQKRLKLIQQPIGDRRAKAVTFITEEDAARRFPREFAAFQETGEVPTLGVPLSDVPGLSRSDISKLHADGVLAVEDMEQLNEDMASQYGRDFLRIWRQVTNWSAINKGSMDVTELSQKTNAAIEENVRLSAQIAEQAAQMQAMQAKMDALVSLGANGAPAMAAVAQPPGEPQSVVNNETSDLPTDLADMDDFLSGGQDVADGDLPADADDDPLTT